MYDRWGNKVKAVAGEDQLWDKWWFWAIVFILVLIAVWMFVWPKYNVWRSKKSGEAQLAEANFAEQVAIAEANARLKSATLNKDAELIDAEAVAKSIEVIGDSLEKNASYLRWQWIKEISDTRNQIIYVPTEANLPILEASRNKSSQ